MSLSFSNFHVIKVNCEKNGNHTIFGENLTMKTLFYFIFSICFIAVSCQKQQNEEKTPEEQTEEVQIIDGYQAFGEADFDYKAADSKEEALDNFENLSVGDSTRMIFASTIDQVCQKKGCWMMLGLDADTQARITFKDYGFFVPLDSSGDEVIVSGWAHKSERPVDELKHFAEDAGKSQEEIDAITEPEVKYTFVAEGVLIKGETENKS